MSQMPLLFNGNRNRNVLVFFILTGLSSLLMLLYECWDYTILLKENDLDAYYMHFDELLMPIFIMAGLVTILSIGFMAIYVAWFYRAYKNLAFKSLSHMRPGWAIAAWFIPLYWWFACYNMFNEIWMKHQVHRAEENKEPLPKLTIIWWLGFILFNMFERVSSITSSFDESISGYKIAALLAIASSVFGLISLLVGYRIHQKLGVLENEFYEAHRADLTIESHLIN